MSNEHRLRRLAKEAIGAARVPAGQPKGTWGGNGTGRVCDVCGLPIPGDEIEFEVEFSQEAGQSHTYHLHSQCFAAWEFERHAFEAEECQARSNGGRPPAI